MRWVAALTIVLCMVSCETDTYDTGDGQYSYLRADFVELHTAAKTLADYAVTDESDTVKLMSPATVSWATTADSLYRALLYYNAGMQGNSFVSAARVPVLTPILTNRVDTLTNDPLGLESVWVSTNKRYLNLGIVVKTGTAEGNDTRQTVALALDTTAVPDVAKDTIRLTLVHHQNGVPQYYSSKSYVSIPLNQLPQDRPIVVNILTYDGLVRYKP
jgi:hypothetical protein